MLAVEYLLSEGPCLYGMLRIRMTVCDRQKQIINIINSNGRIFHVQTDNDMYCTLYT